MTIPSWGRRWSPLLPDSLRIAWAREALPIWVAKQLGLPPGASCSSLDSEVWSRCNHLELPGAIKRFLINLITVRGPSILALQVLTRPWPPVLDPRLLPWSTRTRNCLENSGLLRDTALLSSITFGQLLSIKNMGVTSALDFACVVESVQHVSSQSATEASMEMGGDPVAILLEAIDASWSSQVSQLDPRFGEVLSPGTETVFERLERLTAEPQDPPLAELQLAREIRSLQDRLKEISNLSLESALTVFVEQVTSLRGQGLQALVRRLGVGGEPPATLEESASLIGVTRERVRQLQKRFTDRLPSHPIFMPKLDLAIDAIREAAPIAVDRAAKLLYEKGISTRPFHPESVLEAARFCHRPQPFEIDYSTRIPRVVLEQRKDLERVFLSVGCKQAGASGATNIAEVVAEVGQGILPAMTEEEIRHFLQHCPEVEFLSGDWFWHKEGIPDRNRLRNVTRKMLSIASPIHLSDLREGVQRHYRIRRSRGTVHWPLITPPRAILEAFYRAHPEFAVDAVGQVSSVIQLDPRKELNPTEQVLVDVLRSSPSCLLDYASFGRACSRLGMNPNTFSQYLSSSPVIAHLGIELWSLRGIKVDPAYVEAAREANAARPREKRVIDYGWMDSGDLWFAARLPELHSALVLGIPSAVRRFIAGREFPAADELGLDVGAIRTNEEGTASYGYGRFLARSGADEDDLLLVTFRLTDGKTTLRLISDDELEDLSPA
jgi:hypothetical protein